MRILMLTANLPYPPASGGALRSYGLIHGLHAAGHEITLLSFHDGSTTVEGTPLAKACVRIETGPPPRRTKVDRLRDVLLTSKADIERRMYSTEFHRRLKGLLHQYSFDLIQFEGIEVACYLPFVRQMQPPAQLCFDTFNAEYALQRVIFEVDRRDPKRLPGALYSLVQSRRIKRFEREVCQQADLVIAVSPEDAEALREFRADGRIFVVPNGIFADDYRAPIEVPDLGGNALVFTGKMDYRPNVDAMLWFAGAILPAIQQQVSDVRLIIVGQKPHPKIAALHGQGNITITGWVDSVQPYLHSAAVYIAPLRMGSGTRLKILEALASGCPVVTTSIAASGLLPEAKRAMIIADEEAEMAKAIVNLLRDPAQRRELGALAKTAVQKHYDWSVLIPRLLSAYRESGVG
jgi:glycosyltransferase involved in cell wall biosynthesis